MTIIELILQRLTLRVVLRLEKGTYSENSHVLFCHNKSLFFFFFFFLNTFYVFGFQYAQQFYALTYFTDFTVLCC